MSDRPNQTDGKGIIADLGYQLGDLLAKWFDQVQATEYLSNQKEQIRFYRSHHDDETEQKAKIDLVLTKQFRKIHA